MRKIREVLRLTLGQGLPQRAVGHSLQLSQGAVHGYVTRTRLAGLGWPFHSSRVGSAGGELTRNLEGRLMRGGFVLAVHRSPGGIEIATSR
ncbi:MAG: hypothetical protein ACREFJ_16220 [Acetobacteraceae bacterium]